MRNPLCSLLRNVQMGGIRTAAVAVLGVGFVATSTIAVAPADNKRLNDGVVANVFTIQHQAGCTNDVKINLKLQFAAQQHAVDVRDNRALDGDLGSDGSLPQDRAHAAGFAGVVSETVAINPAVAINNLDVLNQWYGDPDDLAIMSNCANTEIGVWSENSPDRSVVVAVYGQPS